MGEKSTGGGGGIGKGGHEDPKCQDWTWELLVFFLDRRPNGVLVVLNMQHQIGIRRQRSTPICKVCQVRTQKAK